MAMPLSDHTTDALLTELVRRRNTEESEAPIERWCHDCRHFKPESRAGESYNPCQKKHRMSFHFPDSWESPESSGFFRRVCVDFEAPAA